MRKVFLIIAVLTIVSLVVGFYPDWVEKPVKDGSGPLAVRIAAQYPAPEYHSPLDWWQTHHMDLVNRGDLMQNDCLYCHEPAKSCNNCHGYVGVDPIIAKERINE
ncbi:MAG: hypothetical protein ACUVR4_08695 [Anaerolineae bacterium]